MSISVIQGCLFCGPYQLNARLQDGEEGGKALTWLNGLTEVELLLDASFEDRSIAKQNLSDWRMGGYEEWLLQQDIMALTHDFSSGAA
jgi:hypothetical protein